MNFESHPTQSAHKSIVEKKNRKIYTIGHEEKQTIENIERAHRNVSRPVPKSIREK